MRVLLTRDGRKMGNAIIIREVAPHPAAAEYLLKTGQKMFLIETDFGNQCRLSSNEISELFYDADELREAHAWANRANYPQWHKDRHRAINQTRVEPSHER